MTKQERELVHRLHGKYMTDSAKLTVAEKDMIDCMREMLLELVRSKIAKDTGDFYRESLHMEKAEEVMELGNIVFDRWYEIWKTDLFENMEKIGKLIKSDLPSRYH